MALLLLPFVVKAQTLSPPNLVWPGTSSAPYSSLPATTPTFQWHEVAGADGYALYISKFNGSAYDLIFDSSTNGVLTGASYKLPSGCLLIDGQYRWNMATHNSIGYGSPNASRLYFSVVDSGTTFYLSFPLPNRDSTTATINSVFDHSMATPYTSNGVVTAYTGEEGSSQYDKLYVTTIGGIALYEYKNSGNTNFAVNGHYFGGGTQNCLSYDGHPGIDFRTKDPDQDPTSGIIDVLAAADGTLNNVPNSDFNTVIINHTLGYTTHYLHLSTTNYLPTGTHVTRGQVIGKSGEKGAPNAPHLHFEVHLNDVPVDPYGWTGTGNDPYTGFHPGVVNVNLWTTGSGGGVDFQLVISNPKLTGTTFTLATFTESNINYILEYKNALNDLNWIPLQTNRGSGGMINFTNTGVPGSNRFYLILTQ